MAHKVCIDGTAYEIDDGKAMVDGTVYEIDHGKTLVDGTAYEVGFVTQIGELAVGSSVFLNVNGAKTEFLVVHQGKPSSMYDDSCNGTWLLMKDCYTKVYFDSSNNDYENSNVHSYLNNALLGLFDSDIQSDIKQIKLPYHKGTGSGGSVSSGANGLSTKLFLLGGYEVGLTQSTSKYFPIDGAKLDYFISGNDTDAKSRRIANYDGSAASWWLRSPSTRDTGDAWQIWGNGDCERARAPDTENAYGIRPALVLPSNFLI